MSGCVSYFLKHQNLFFHQRLIPFSFKGMFLIFETPKPLFSSESEPFFFKGVFIIFETSKPLFSSEVFNGSSLHVILCEG
jgi:hypothetical protein